MDLVDFHSNPDSYKALDQFVSKIIWRASINTHFKANECSDLADDSIALRDPRLWTLEKYLSSDFEIVGMSGRKSKGLEIIEILFLSQLSKGRLIQYAKGDLVMIFPDGSRYLNGATKSFRRDSASFCTPYMNLLSQPFMGEDKAQVFNYHPSNATEPDSMGMSWESQFTQPSRSMVSAGSV